MKLTSAICAAAAVVLLAGCATEAPAPAVAVATPAPAVVASGPAMTLSSVYYDRFYGPVYAGYWGSDGLFHYEMTAGGPWVIDTAHHFRRDAANGFQVVTITPVIVPAA